VRRRFALPGGLVLATTEPRRSGAAGDYPTDGLQKGLLLLDGEQEVGGEGVGFGVPILKRGARAVFPGSFRTTSHDTGSRPPGDPPSLTLTYRLDRLERLRGGKRSRRALAPLDLVRESLSLIYRRVPPLRRPLTAVSTAGRRLLSVSTRFEETTPLGEVSVTYALPAAADWSGTRLVVTADLSGLPPSVTEVVLMNELGAADFDLYEESGRTEQADSIGAWDQVAAASARFRSSASGVWFELQSRPDPAAPGARLFRGREVAPGRLAWAGFGYSLRPGPATFTYTVRFGRNGDVREAETPGIAGARA
jgi:hypothetical protein